MLCSHFVANSRFARISFAFGILEEYFLISQLFSQLFSILSYPAFVLHPYMWHSGILLMADLHKYSLCTAWEWWTGHVVLTRSIALLLVNWATMAAPIVNRNICFKVSLKVHSIKKLNKTRDGIQPGMIIGLWDFEGFWTIQLLVPLCHRFKLVRITVIREVSPLLSSHTCCIALPDTKYAARWPGSYVAFVKQER